MSRFLIDTNVCLDAALLRIGNKSALKILSSSETGLFEGILAAHAADTIFYILEHEVNKNAAYEVLNGLAKTVRIGEINQAIFDYALKAQWNDFEDALHYFCAINLKCDGIISRNKKDFKKSELPVYEPDEFVTQFLNGF